MPPDRVHVRFDDDLRRSRPAVLLRIVLAIPAALLLLAWTPIAACALPLAWIVTLARGRAPRALHRVLRGYACYWVQWSAWLNLVSGRYPPLRRQGEHPVQIDAPRVTQARLVTLFRPVLALPGLVLASVLGVVLGCSAIAAWFASLLRGRTTVGLHELGAFCLRYQTETLAFVLLLTPRAPRLEPPRPTGGP